jgi:hypothetical protein
MRRRTNVECCGAVQPTAEAQRASAGNALRSWGAARSMNDPLPFAL